MKLYLSILIGMAVLAFTQLVRAETAVGVHQVSIHSQKYQAHTMPRETWNNVNPGIYIHHDNWVGGVYYNSERRTSVYAGYAYPVTDYFDLVAGVVTGYRGYTLAPILIPSLHLPLTDKIEVRLNLAVGVKGGATAINLALEYRL
jgi:hypothetical protein